MLSFCIRPESLPFSFGRHDSVKHNQEVFDAFYWIFGKQIPKFVETEIANSDRHLHPSELVSAMHSYGINIRFLGFLRSLLKCPLSLQILTVLHL
jgi:hypothetical protein